MALVRSPTGLRATLPGPCASFKPYEPNGQDRPSAPTSARPQSLLRAASVNLVQTLGLQSTHAPRRVLTKPSDRSTNEGFDNSKGDLVVSVADVITSPSGASFEVLSALGQGTFGQVFRVRSSSNKAYALKIIRNGPSFRKQAELEVSLLDALRLPREVRSAEEAQAKSDRTGDRRALIVQLRDHFWFRGHQCLVFEHLGVNLLQLLQQTDCRGLGLSLIRYFTKQLLQALALLGEMGIIHCDIKPENVLLLSLQSPAIKLIDFGSACTVSHARAERRATYIQSRFYRSPEVLLGCAYDCAIDTWSLGTIVAELFLGLPLFAGENEYNQVARIMDTLGPPPDEMLEEGVFTAKFFSRRNEGAQGLPRFSLKPESMLAEEAAARQEEYKLSRNKQYFRYKLLPELIDNHRTRQGELSESDRRAETERRRAMCSFCLGLLRYSPRDRWTPSQALAHPFITGERFKGDFTPPPAAAPPPLVPPAAVPTGQPAPAPDAAVRRRADDVPAVAATAPPVAAQAQPPAAAHAQPPVAQLHPPTGVAAAGAAAAVQTAAQQGARSPTLSQQQLLQRSPPQAIWNGQNMINMPPQFALPPYAVGMQMASSPMHMSPSPPAFFGSSPLSVSPPSMATLHIAMGGAGSQAPYPQNDGGVFFAQMPPMGASPPGGYHFQPPVHCEGGCGASPYGVQLAVSPPDRQHMMGPPVQERLGECAQCKAYGRGVVDKRDGNLYCYSCWQHYEASSCDGHTPPTSPPPNQQPSFGSMAYVLNPYYQAAPPAPPLRLAVNTGGAHPMHANVNGSHHHQQQQHQYQQQQQQHHQQHQHQHQHQQQQQQRECKQQGPGDRRSAQSYGARGHGPHGKQPNASGRNSFGRHARGREPRTSAQLPGEGDGAPKEEALGPSLPPPLVSRTLSQDEEKLRSSTDSPDGGLVFQLD